jgi:hypothetical protein
MLPKNYLERSIPITNWKKDLTKNVQSNLTQYVYLKIKGRNEVIKIRIMK